MGFRRARIQARRDDWWMSSRRWAAALRVVRREMARLRAIDHARDDTLWLNAEDSQEEISKLCWGKGSEPRASGAGQIAV